MKIFCTVIAWAVGILFAQLLFVKTKKAAHQKTTKVAVSDLSEIYARLDQLTETQNHLVEMTKYNLSVARILCINQQKHAHDYETAAQLQNIINNIEDLLN